MSVEGSRVGGSCRLGGAGVGKAGSTGEDYRRPKSCVEPRENLNFQGALRFSPG